MSKNNNKNKLKWLIYLIFGGFLIKFFRYVFKGDNEKKIAGNFKDFFRKEKKEVGELVSGEQSLKKYVKDSCSIFTNYFVPSECNDFKPRVLRTKPLAIIAIALLILKASVTGYLFFIYPNLAKMSAVMQDEIKELINSERIVEGENILETNEILNRVAKAKADDMIKNSYFAHKSPDGKMIWDTINRSEYPYLYVGENLAMNFTSAQSAHKALMLSPTHKKNILNDKYTEVGIAVASGEINGQKTNILVQVFGHAKIVKPAIAKIEEPAAPKAVETEISPAPNTPPTPSPLGSAQDRQGGTAPELVVAGEEVVKETADVAAEMEANTNTPPTPSLEGTEEVSPAVPVINGDSKKIEEPKTLALAGVKEMRIEIKNGTAAKVINYSQYIFIGAMVLLLALLLVNILVRISIQHKPVIVQTLLVILFVYGLATVKFHFLESVVDKILIM